MGRPRRPSRPATGRGRSSAPPISPRRRLAAEKGAFPLFDRDAYLAGERSVNWRRTCATLIAEHGIRNALLTSVAPTGTISLVADNVSSGVEPVFALAYTRKVLQPDGTKVEEEVSDYALRRFRAQFGDDAALPDYFVTAQDLTPAEHVRMQAAVQRHVDSAISKTVNVPADISFEDVPGGLSRRLPQRLQGLHDLPAERDHRVGAGGEAGRAPRRCSACRQLSMSDLMVRSEKLIGATYKLRWPDSEHAMYVTINDIEHGRRAPAVRGVRQLEEPRALRLGRGADAHDQRGVPPRRRGRRSSPRNSSRCSTRAAGNGATAATSPSLVAAIGDVIERHMIETGFLTPAEPIAGKLSAPTPSAASAAPAWAAVPEMQPTRPGAAKPGCLSCVHCGWSKCS